MSLEKLHSRIAAISDLLCAVNLLTWDQRTMMPAGGAQARGRQIATLTRLARDDLASDATMELLERAETETDDALEQEGLRQIRHAAELHRRVPAAIVERRAALRAGSHQAWLAARAADDFSIFAPHLEQTIDAARDYADAIGWRQHRYDAMLSLFEPGETLASLRSLFADLKAGLTPLVERALERQGADPMPQASFDPTRQLELARTFAGLLGYDRNHGRLDPTVHPFEISFTRDDVRITTRTRANDIKPPLFGAMHEVGHALYEQNVDPAFTRGVFATDLVGLYAVGGTSFGAHESQSRLFENHVGRSRRFWELHLHHVQAAFPDAFGAMTPETFYAAVTRVARGTSRTEADELTYDFHVMLRVEMEAQLMSGELAAKHVPEAWRSALQAALGVTPKGDLDGALQDIHWSSGMIGSFCTYTIGNVMAAQLFAAAQRAEPGIAVGIERGDYAPLRVWLGQNIWCHGRSLSRDTLVRRATGRGLEVRDYLAHLAMRYG